MSTRAELKGRAKNCLRQYFMPALLVCIVQMLLTGTLPLPRMGVSLNVNTVGSAITGGGGLAETLGEGDLGYMLMVLPVLLMGMLFSFAIGTLYSVFVGNVIYVGSSRYFMESREYGQDRGIGKLFYGFKSGAYFSLVSASGSAGNYQILSVSDGSLYYGGESPDELSGRTGSQQPHDRRP